MEKLTLSTSIRKASYDELDVTERALVDRAKASTFNSYAPYSHFSVGAALLLEDGTIVPGCNQENSVYPCTICAERSAIFAAGAIYPDKKPVAICVAARDTSGAFIPRPISPCGSCRQVMVETEQRYQTRLKVILYGASATYLLDTAQDLLPVTFDSTYL